MISVARWRGLSVDLQSRLGVRLDRIHPTGKKTDLPVAIPIVLLYFGGSFVVVGTLPILTRAC